MRAILWNHPVEIELQLDTGLTYCVEILYPENRIVVNYGGREDLVLLAAFCSDGTEVPFNKIVHHWNDIGSVVKSYAAPTLGELLVRAESNLGIENTLGIVGGTDAEGFVLRFQSGIRAKVKYSEYVRLHRLLTGITQRDIWRAVAFDDMVVTDVTVEQLVRALRCSPDEIQKMQVAPNGALGTIVEGCPDEFDQWVNGIVTQLRHDFVAATTQAKLVFAEVRNNVGTGDRGIFARTLNALGEGKTTVSCCFAMLDNKPIAPLIWRSLYPAASTPFKEDDDG